jgi:hypothetical protein
VPKFTSPKQPVLTAAGIIAAVAMMSLLLLPVGIGYQWGEIIGVSGSIEVEVTAQPPDNGPNTNSAGPRPLNTPKPTVKTKEPVPASTPIPIPVSTDPVDFIPEVGGGKGQPTQMFEDYPATPSLTASPVASVTESMISTATLMPWWTPTPTKNKPGSDAEATPIPRVATQPLPTPLPRTQPTAQPDWNGPPTPTLPPEN